MPRVQLSKKPTAAVKKSPVTVKQSSVKKPVAAPAKKSPVTVKSQKPAAAKALTGLSLKQIWRATPSLMKNNSKEVIIRRVSHLYSKMGMPALKVKAQSVERGAKLLYDVVVIGKEKDIPLYKQKHVLLSCSCPNHMYYWEYALTKWGSSQIKYSNGEPAHTTNPGNLPGCCKHSAAVITLIMENKF